MLQSASKRWWLALVLGAATGCGGDAAAPAPAADPPADAGDDEAAIAAAMALPEPQRCAGCHGEKVTSWRTSGHGYALQPVAEADLQALPGAHVSGASPFRLEVARGPGELTMHLVDADGEYRAYQVTHVLGGMERQMYIAPMGPDGRPQMLPAEWGREKQSFRQFWRPQDQNTVPPGDPVFWRTFDRAFTNDCVRCHSPRTQVTYDPDAGAYHVDWGRPGDVGIRCATCHGDCDAHVESALRHQRRRRPDEKPLPTKGAAAELLSCSRCHSQSTRVGRFPKADEEFYDALNPTLLDDPVYYFPNGRNFGESGHSLLSWELAECFRKGGLRCTDCHPVHGGGTVEERLARSRASCARCHESAELPPSCIKHPGPQAAGGGADCLQCHMPRFAVANGHAHVTDHRIAAPDPVLTRELDIPNACQECHADKSIAWQVAAVEGWGMKARPERARTLALGRAMQNPPDPAALPALRAYIRDPATPWPVAASMARVLGRVDAGHPDSLATLLATVTREDHPMIRAGAAYGLAYSGAPEAVAALRARLDDPRRVVRVMAATSLVVRRDPESLARALAQIKEIVDEVPDYFDLRFLHAWGLLFSGDPAAALAEARRCEKMHFDDDRVQQLIGACEQALAEQPR